MNAAIVETMFWSSRIFWNMPNHSTIVRPLGVVALGACSFFVAARPCGACPIPTSMASPSITRIKLASVLIDLGFGPESLCACQIAPAAVSSFVQTARSTLDSRTDDITSAEGRISTARTALASLQSRRDPPASAEEIAAAGSELEAARNAFATLQAELFASLVQAFTPDQQQALTRARANRQWGVPIQYLVTDRTPSEWVNLREALAAARDAESHQRTADSAVQAIISSAESSPATAAAVQALSLHRMDCRAAWSRAVGELP